MFKKKFPIRITIGSLFSLIIITIVTLACAAYLGYKLGKEETRTETINNSQIVENNEVNGWRSYQILGKFPWLEFQYPKEWGELLYDLGDPELGGIYHFLPYQKIKEVWYHKPSNTLAFMEREKKCLTFGGIEAYEKTLKVIGQNKEVKTIIGPGAIKPTGGYCQSIESINFSPDGKYIYFGISGWENWEPMIVDIESGLNIIENYNIWFGADNIYKNIVWSPDNKVLAIGSEYCGFGGEGSNAIFVSDYNRPKELTKITSPLGWGEEFSDYYKFDNLDFVNNNTLRFSLFFSKDGSFCTGCAKEIKAKYEYNLQTGKVKRTF